MKNGILEAMQNPDFEKIRKAVIMNRHPEAKDFEEALKNETQFDECLLNYNTHLSYTCEKVASDIVIECTARKIDAKSGQHNIKTMLKFLPACLMLGRVITLEDILILFPDLNCGNDGLFIALPSFNGSYDYDGICDWQLTKPLHEQTTKTWNAIANLLI